MNLRELYVLNLALDGKDIPLLPTAREAGLKPLAVETVKDRFINHGILKSYDEFTEKGLRLTGRLLKYKQAKKHIRLEKFMIGIVSPTQCVVIQYNPFFAEYTIDNVKGATAEQLTLMFDFLKSTAGADGTPSRMQPGELEKSFKLGGNNSFKLSLESEQSSSEEIYLCAENALYIYDCREELLRPVSRSRMLEELNERMSVNG